MFVKKSAIAEINVDMTEITWQNNGIAIFQKDLCEAAGISHASVAKLGKNENVTTDVLVKICTALKCDISDIMEIIEIEREKA